MKKILKTMVWTFIVIALYQMFVSPMIEKLCSERKSY